jgi:hypothetical protein
VTELTHGDARRPSPVGRYPNQGLTLHWGDDAPPEGSDADAVILATPDRAVTTGMLYRPAGSARGVVTITHPRVDVTGHYLVPPLLRAGWAVWAQRTRFVNNDLTCVHEQLLVDVAVAHQWLRSEGLEDQWLLGNSGGASLYCFYMQQSSLPPEERLARAPSGMPVDLTLDMPAPRGLILLAPHPGQGDLLLQCIDPAVAVESDPLSVVPELDLFDESNGFREPPTSSSYAADFLESYRAAQVARVKRIDERARELVKRRETARKRAKEEDDVRARREALAPSYLITYRTDADPRTVDLSLDPSARDYGSIIGRRPDLTNFGHAGFARMTTPDAWLSTWSGTSTNAALRLTAPSVQVPSLVVGFDADNSVFPEDLAATEEALGVTDKKLVTVSGDHFGFRPGSLVRSGGDDAASAIVGWLDDKS